MQQEELKVSNKELQSMNDEWRSTAQELETSREELQSLNKELTTINQELKIKIEELSLSNDDFQNLINSTDIGTIFLDHSLRVKLFTPRARDIFNLIPSDAGRPLTDITGNLVDDGLLRNIETVQETLQTIEREVATRNRHWYLMRLVPYRTSEVRIRGFILTFFDITERKQAEEMLRQSEERLRLMLESVTDYAIIASNAEGIIERWNVGAERLFGYTQEEATNCSCEIIFTPEDRARDIPASEMQQAREQGSALEERWHVRQDNSLVYVSGVITPLRDGDGAVTGYVKILRDLTERRQAEDNLRRAHEELETRVQERTRQLAEANESLRAEIIEREQSEAVGVQLLRQLVTSQEDERRRIARDLHDHLGQQLTALRLKIAALIEAGGDDQKLRGQIEEAQKLAAQLDEDVDFLAWELRPAALDDLGLAMALADYVQEWSRHFDIPVEFHTSVHEANRFAPEIETNFYRIAQEALNNIYKHARANRVDVILEQRDGYAVLIIEDDGAGFDVNQMMNSNLSPKANSDRGLGLTGMRERVALLGGTLQIESEPGAGTTIFVRVPSSSAEESDKKSKA